MKKFNFELGILILLFILIFFAYFVSFENVDLTKNNSIKTIIFSKEIDNLIARIMISFILSFIVVFWLFFALVSSDFTAGESL